jgi:hypothetical protein
VPVLAMKQNKSKKKLLSKRDREITCFFFDKLDAKPVNIKVQFSIKRGVN